MYTHTYRLSGYSTGPKLKTAVSQCHFCCEFLFLEPFIQETVLAKQNLPNPNFKQRVPAKTHFTPQECPQQTASR